MTGFRLSLVVRHCRIFCFLLAVALLQACASPSEKLMRRAGELGFTRQAMPANGFTLESFHNNPRQQSHHTDVLHVYLEGDGMPWVSVHWIADEPTPRFPLMLELMAFDPNPSLYLGRPCYNGHAQDAGCNPWLWTYRRYAPEVVQAMVAALQGYLRGNAQTELVFIGHSGGGALALLMASQFAQTRAVVTLAGNSDIDVWADWHGYDRLQGSLNPAAVPAGAFQEIHLLGGRDAVIPPLAFLPVLKRRQAAQILIIPGFGHVCCWQALWPRAVGHLP